MILTTILTKIANNMKIVLISALLIVLALLLHQCNKTSEAVNKLNDTIEIANANLKGMKDSTIQLSLTREQLKEYDTKLSTLVSYSDSLIKLLDKKNKVIEILNIRPKASTSERAVANHAQNTSPVIIKDTNNITKKYAFDWKVDDSVKSFSGTTSVYLVKNKDTLNIISDSTKIRNFKLNFDMVIIKYDDDLQKLTKYKITPYLTDNNGGVHEISDNELSFTFRGIELLDRPWNPNVIRSKLPGKKMKFKGLWGVGMNPIGVSVIGRNNVLSLSYGPSITFGYFLTLQKK